jgi:hypothetical protein
MQQAKHKRSFKLFWRDIERLQWPWNLHLGLYSESTHSTELLSCAAAQLPKYKRARDLGGRCPTWPKKTKYQAMFKHYTIRRQKWRNIQANQNQKRCKTANDFETFDIRPSSDHHIFLKTFSELKAPRPVTLGALLLPQGQTSPQTSVSRVRVTEISRVWVESPSTTSMAFSARESFYAHLSAFLVMWDGVKCVEIKSDPNQKTCSKGIVECLCQETTETARAGHLTAQWRLPGPPAHRGTYMPRVGGEREREREGPNKKVYN